MPKVKTKANAVVLDKQFKVPVEALDGLIPTAQEVTKPKKGDKKARKEGAFEVETDESEPEDDADGNDLTELNPRKAAKKLMKAEKRERRKQKKELKVAFKKVEHKMQGTRQGISVRKID